MCALHHPLCLSVLQTDALAADPSNSRLAARVSTLWRSFSFVNSFYIKLKVRRTVQGQYKQYIGSTWVPMLPLQNSSGAGAEAVRFCERTARPRLALKALLRFMCQL